MRLREFRKAKGITQSKIAEMLGVTQSGYASYEIGRSNIPIELLIVLAKYYGTTTDKLIGCNNTTDIDRTKTKHYVNVYGNIAAGLPIEAIEDIIDTEEITPEMAMQGEHFGLRVKGDSMAPHVLHEDIVIIKKQPNIESGEIAAVLVNGDSATLKKILKSKDGVTLIPLNPAYQPMYYPNEQIIDLPIVIIGKMVELRRKY